MNQTETILGFEYIKEQLKGFAATEQAKQKIEELEPYLKEVELRKNMRETTQARRMLDKLGNPPLPLMTGIEVVLNQAIAGELVSAEEMEAVGSYLAAVRRLQEYLERGKQFELGIAYYSENLVLCDALEKEIHRCIRNGKVDDYASSVLQSVRRKILVLEEKIKGKAESILKSNKKSMSDQFIVHRNGHICLPVKKEYKGQIKGSVIDQSGTGTTFFIEPESVTALGVELELLQIEEDTEERRILYTIMDQIAEQEAVFKSNMEMIVKLDFMFAKGKLSIEQQAVEPEIQKERSLFIKAGRHPQLDASKCVPLDFSMEEATHGIIITGPNTGGKTVAIKTVGLLCMMAGAGLHVPCQEARLCMFNCIRTDIGDGQNLTDNLSTFSAHIKNVINILNSINEDSLVILDEVGSGTDPLEGMGIAISILEKLREKKCTFLVTTHYPEVKEYAERHGEILNARMAFDREKLCPLYQLEIGSAGESCALYIAQKLGLPEDMLQIAAKEAYGEARPDMWEASGPSRNQQPQGIPKIIYAPAVKKQQNQELLFSRGDSVTVLPEGKIGIVVKAPDEKGNVLVQIKKEKIVINQKRLKLKVAATELYPDDYDFSIIFDSVETRKNRHRLEKGHDVGMSIELEDY